MAEQVPLGIAPPSMERLSYVDARRALAPSDEGKTLPSGERCLSEGQTEWGEGAAEAIARLGERNTERFRVLSLPPSRLTPCHLHSHTRPQAGVRERNRPKGGS